MSCLRQLVRTEITWSRISQILSFAFWLFIIRYPSPLFWSRKLLRTFLELWKYLLSGRFYFRTILTCDWSLNKRVKDLTLSLCLHISLSNYFWLSVCLFAYKVARKVVSQRGKLSADSWNVFWLQKVLLPNTLFGCAILLSLCEEFSEMSLSEETFNRRPTGGC